MKTKFFSTAIFILLACYNYKSQTTTDANSENQQSSKNVEYPIKSTLLQGFAAIPLGEFGKTDIENGGFAKQGYGVGFNSKNTIGKGFSFVFLTTYSWVDIDAEAMSKEFTKYLNSRTEISGGQHQPLLTTVGLNYDYYITDRIKFGINGQAGVIYNSFRPFEIKTYDANNNLIYDDIISYESKFAFAYNFGFDVNFFLIPKVMAFQISADYYSGKLDTYLISQSFPPTKSVDKMQFLNLGIGFVFYTQK